MSELQNKMSKYLNHAEKDLNIDQIVEMQFWTCEYTKRKYVLDIQERDDYKIITSNSELNNDILNNSRFYVKHYGDILLGICGKKEPFRFQYIKEINEIIISFHNAIYDFNPKYVINQDRFRIEELRAIYVDSERLKAAKVIHDDAENYGFIPLEVARIYDMAMIAGHKRVTQNFLYLNLQMLFLKNTKLDVELNYVDDLNVQHFDNDLNADTIYIYMRCLDNQLSLNALVKNAILLINCALKNKNMHIAGNIKEADVQICIDKYFYKKNKITVKEILRHSFAAYRNCYFPSIFMFTKDTLKMAKHLYVPKYEQVPFHIRAMGLWIWDRVNFENIKISKAIAEARDIEEFFQSKTTERSSIERAYRLAKRSVESMMPCIFSDL